MRSLSEVLIKKREEKNLTISQVSYETNISKKYIQALEEEDFGAFPAEAYLLGFLRNYAEFLEIEYDSIYSEYRNCLLREEPTPLSELMGVKKSLELKPWMIIAPLIIIALVFIVPATVRGIGSQIDKRKESLRLVADNASKTLVIDDDFSGKKVKKGDSLVLYINKDQLSYIVKEVTSDITLIESYLGKEKEITLKLGKEFVTEFKIEQNQLVLVTLFLKDVGGFSDNSAIVKARSEVKELLPETEDGDTITETTSDSEGKDGSKVIMVRKHSPEAYSMAIKFDGDIQFRYRLKGQELKENFYRKGSVLNLDITRNIQIWTSNAGLTKLKINGKNLVLGKSGAVHVFSLRWLYVKDKDEYKLEYNTAY